MYAKVPVDEHDFRHRYGIKPFAGPLGQDRLPIGKWKLSQVADEAQFWEGVDKEEEESGKGKRKGQTEGSGQSAAEGWSQWELDMGC